MEQKFEQNGNLGNFGGEGVSSHLLRLKAGQKLVLTKKVLSLFQDD